MSVVHKTQTYRKMGKENIKNETIQSFKTMYTYISAKLHCLGCKCTIFWMNQKHYIFDESRTDTLAFFLKM